MLKKRSIDQSAFDILEMARYKAEIHLNRYITPEHVLFQIEASGFLSRVLNDNHMSSFYFRDRLNPFIDSLKSSDSEAKHMVQMADSLRFAIISAFDIADLQGDEIITVPHLLVGITKLKDSLAGYLLLTNPAILRGIK